jgi:hypothetical protein
LWSGQDFDRWKLEIEKWFEDNKASEEHKYQDLMESLTKNAVIKDFVVKTLDSKVGTTRTVKRVLEVMTEKYAKTTGEKILEIMKKISNFKTENKVDGLINNFEEMVTETKKLKLAENLEYALGLQFVERLEAGGKINSGEKMRLKDVLEDVDGEPKAGNTIELMKKELRKIKVTEDREPFKKEHQTFFTRNDENRSRYNNWRNSLQSKGYGL